jgi:hypothetical protein
MLDRTSSSRDRVSGFAAKRDRAFVTEGLCPGLTAPSIDGLRLDWLIGTAFDFRPTSRSTLTASTTRPLAAACPSPATAPPFEGSIPGSTFPACYFAYRLSRTQARSAFRSTTASGSPRSRPLPRFGPLPVRFLARSTLPPASTPLRDFYIPLDRSVQPASRRSVRLPAPPDFLSLPASGSISSLGNGSTFLACYFATGSVARKPVRLPLHDRFRFAPVAAASMLRPVACSLPRPIGSSTGLHSPSGFLHPSGSKCSASFAPISPPSGSARFPLAPRFQSYF